MADKLISFAVKGIGSGIGLASESITAHKNKKNAEKASKSEASSRDITPQQSHEEKEQEADIHVDEDEKQWNLDEAQDHLVERTLSQTEPPADAAKTVVAFVERHPTPVYSELDPAPLPYRIPVPVILPQRRPKDHSRGFIRAYAPVLEDCGIDQAMFIDFLNTFEKASQASPWINAINLAGFAGMALPTPISIAISVALTIATTAAMEVQSRHRTNNFLDKINKEFFQPRGLYCLVMKWNPESAARVEQLDLNTKLTASLTGAPEHGLAKMRNHFRPADGNTYGNESILEAAPLVYPALDALAGQTGEEAKTNKTKLKAAGTFVDDYWDRRAQAKYAGENPDSALLVQQPKPKFTSRYADPNHPASSGHIVSLITGGHINPPSFGGRGRGRGFGGGLGGGLGGLLGGRGGGGGFGGGLRGGRGRGFGGEIGDQQNQYQQNQYQDQSYMREGGMQQGGLGAGYEGSEDQGASKSGGRGNGGGYGWGGMNSGGGGGFGGGLGGGRGGGFGGVGPAGLGVVKKLLQKRVLYLMIVNMPTEQDMQEAMEQLEVEDAKMRQ